MPDRHILLIKCTLKLELIELPERIRAAVEANNGTRVDWYWTVGAFDLVAIVDLESRFMPMFARQVEDDQDVSSVVVMRAYNHPDVQDALMSWKPVVSTDDDPWGNGGKVGR